MKFKFFWSDTGNPPQEEINNWLLKYPKIEIIHIICNQDKVYVFYKEQDNA